MIRRRASVAAALIVLVTAAPTAGPISADESDRIAFASDRSGNAEIYVMNADGTGPVNLTNNAAQDFSPNWSPDGKRIVFARGSGSLRELYVMNADGTNQTRLTFNTVADVQPVWSPNGKQLAFVRFGPDGDREIYVMDAEPNGATVQVVDGPGFFDFMPDWAPNGQIAFSSDRGDGDQNGVFSIKGDGSKLRRLSPPELFAGSPGWSPDGHELVAVDNFCEFCPESDVVVIEPDTGEIRQLTDTADNESFPDFSPDGGRIAYNAGTLDVPNPGDFGTTDIYVIDADGGEPANLTNSPEVNDVHADWEPQDHD